MSLLLSAGRGRWLLLGGRLRHSLAALWLACASLFFYAFWDPRFLWALLASISFNYVVARRLAGSAPARRKPLLTFAIALNLAALAYFKYTNFSILTLNQLAGRRLPLADIVLPLGISFVTFTQIAFLVDVHRGIAREYNFVHYLLFVKYFPHLITGPVLHHKQMMPQFANPAIYRPKAECFAIASISFAIGIAKKLVLADALGAYATQVFDASEPGASFGAAIAVLRIVGAPEDAMLPATSFFDTAYHLGCEGRGVRTERLIALLAPPSKSARR